MPADMIQWKRGEFHTFYATIPMRVGGQNGSDPVEFVKDDEFEYDGSVCRYAGREFPQPSLRSAIRSGWASPVQDGTASPAAFTAPRDIALSQSKGTDLSRVQRRRRAPMESDALDEDTVLEVGDRARARDSRTGSGHLTRDNNRRASGFVSQPDPESRMAVTASELDDQDAVEIAPLRSKARNAPVDVLRNPRAAQEVEDSMDHAKGLGRFAGQRRPPALIQREGVTIKTSVGDMDRSQAVEVADDVAGGRRVANVRHSSSAKKSVEGISVQDTSGDGGRASREASRHAPKPAKAALAAPPKPKAPRIPDDASPKLKVAVRLCPEFPVDWNFFAKPEDKVSRIKKLGASSSLLDALYAVESPAMKKVLEQKYKSHFA